MNDKAGMRTSRRGVFRVTRKRSNYPVWHLHWRCNHIPVSLPGPVAFPLSHRVLWAVKTCSDVWSSPVLSWTISSVLGTTIWPRKHPQHFPLLITRQIATPWHCRHHRQKSVFRMKFLRCTAGHNNVTTRGNLGCKLWQGLPVIKVMGNNLRFITLFCTDTLHILQLDKLRADVLEISQFVIHFILTHIQEHFPGNYLVSNQGWHIGGEKSLKSLVPSFYTSASLTFYRSDWTWQIAEHL